MTIQERLEAVQIWSIPPLRRKNRIECKMVDLYDYDALLRAFRHLYQEVKGEIQSSSSSDDYAQVIARMDDEILQAYEGKK